MDYTVGISDSLEKIFAGITIGELDTNNPLASDIVKAAKENYARMQANFPSNIFQDEYAILYDIMVGHKQPVTNANQISAIIDNNRDLVLDSPFVDLSRVSQLRNGNATTDDEKVEIFKQSITDTLKRLSNMYVTPDDFNSACIIFIDYFRNKYTEITGHNIVRIMSDEGYTESRPGKRRVSYKGAEDAKVYWNERMKLLDELSETKKIRSVVIDNDWLIEEQKKENMPDENALMTVGIKKIDETVGDLRRSNMLGILGPPKGGKTRFTNFLVQRALQLGLNVCVWPLEGTKEEWISMQLAAFIARNHKVEIDSKSILQRKYASPQEESLVKTARFEIVAKEGYGRLSFIEGAAYCEDFISVIDTHYQTVNPFDVIVIDSPVNILSRTGRQKTDRISSAYMELKAYISNRMKRPALAILPAQLKQDVVDNLRAHPNETIDVTAGSESSETIRSPDTVLGLFSSKEERASGFMKIYSVASRHSGSFDDFQIRTSLKCCYFYDTDN
ncbi:MAG: hypothetical protein IJ593_11065 [Lachnospiraceae bacterium]|nr:hypothetical protein [Lachnospiraceae bacterium]